MFHLKTNSHSTLTIKLPESTRTVVCPQMSQASGARSSVVSNLVNNIYWADIVTDL